MDSQADAAPVEASPTPTSAHESAPPDALLAMTPSKKPAIAKAHASPKGSPKTPKAKAKAKAKASTKAKAKVLKPHFSKPAASNKLLGKNKKKAEDQRSAEEEPEEKKKTKNKRQRLAMKKAAEQKEAEEKKKKAAPQKKQKTDKTVALKKPAASDSKAGKSSSWKEGILKEEKKKDENKKEEAEKEDPEEETGDFEDDACVPVESETRDRSKMQKFTAMYQAGQLPDWIKEEWDKTKAMKSGKRERQSLIVNSLFDRSEQGRLLVNTDKPFFRSMKESFEEKFSKVSTHTLSKRLFMGKFNLTEEALRAGLLEGEFLEIQTPNGPRYQWVEDTDTHKQGTLSGFGWSMGQEGTKDDLAKFKKMTSGNFAQGIAIGESSSSKSTAPQLAIQDADAPLTPEHWQIAQRQLIQAQDALQKLEKEGLKHLQTVGDNRGDPVFELLLLGCKIMHIIQLLGICFNTQQASHKNTQSMYIEELKDLYMYLYIYIYIYIYIHTYIYIYQLIKQHIYLDTYALHTIHTYMHPPQVTQDTNSK